MLEIYTRRGFDQQCLTPKTNKACKHEQKRV